MLESKFIEYLTADTSITSKDKAVKTRMSKARAVEKTLNVSLDALVEDDMKMYQALVTINETMNNNNGAYSNSLRKYYTFKTGKEFPRLTEFYEQNRYEF